jgi:hypothetical protein
MGTTNQPVGVRTARSAGNGGSRQRAIRRL